MALSRIKTLVKKGNNSFGYDHIYVVREKNQILGLSIMDAGGSIDKKVESRVFSTSLDMFGSIRFLFFEKILLQRILTQQIDDHEFYISNVCVNRNHRGKGVGLFLMNNIIEVAKKQSCTRLILDVSKDNTRAVHLYEKVGFIVESIKKSWVWNGTIYKMIYRIDK